MAFAVSKNDNIYLSGTFYSDTLVFGGDTIYSHSADTVANTYVARFDLNGNTKWINTIQGEVFFNEMAIDNNENVYMVGGTQQQTVTIGTYTLSNPPNHGIIYTAAKYDSSGTVKWAKSGGGDNNFATDIKIDNCQNLWVSGAGKVSNFDGHVLFFRPTAWYPVFIVEYDTAGNYIYSTTLTAGAGGPSVHINPDNKGNFYLSGTYNWDTLTFNSDILYPDTSVYSAFEVYSAKFNYDSFQCIQYHFPSQILPINAISPVVTIYPNPTVNNLTIESTQPINDVIITDLLGKLLYKKEHRQQKVQIDVANLPSGFYFIRLNGTEVRKFIKQ